MTKFDFPRPGFHYYLFHKPAGYITAKSDAHRPTIMVFLNAINSTTLHPVGRLDKDTDGLLLLTDDGQFTQFLMHPDNHVPKTYEFYALGTLSKKEQTQLEKGIFLTGSDKPTAPCHIQIIQSLTLADIVSSAIHYASIDSILKNKPETPVTRGLITITEGRNHQVKRLLKHAGCYVVILKRLSIGALTLDEKLLPGEYRLLHREDFRKLFAAHINS